MLTFFRLNEGFSKVDFLLAEAADSDLSTRESAYFPYAQLTNLRTYTNLYFFKSK
jgi:hypothetical protein